MRFLPRPGPRLREPGVGAGALTQRRDLRLDGRARDARSGGRIWVFLAPGRFGLKTPVFEGWKSLDFLGFSRPNRDFSMGYADFSRKFFSWAFPGVERGGGTGACDRGHAEERNCSWGEVNLASDFLQGIVVPAVSSAGTLNSSNCRTASRIDRQCAATIALPSWALVRGVVNWGLSKLSPQFAQFVTAIRHRNPPHSEWLQNAIGTKKQ